MAKLIQCFRFKNKIKLKKIKIKKKKKRENAVQTIQGRKKVMKECQDVK